MLLTVKERLLLLNVLPREGDISTLRIVRDLRAALSFSEAEHAALKFVSEAEQLRWDPTAPQEADVPIGPKAHVLVQETLDRLNKEKPPKLTEDFLPLWDKFAPGG